MKSLFARLLGTRAVTARPPKVFRFNSWPKAVYAVGDIHGCFDLMLQLEKAIVADAAGLDDCWIVYLGDLIDRGPGSAQVLDRALSPAPQGFQKLCLRGNHEAIMLQAIEGRDRFDWLQQGGDATLQSYGVPTDRMGRYSTQDQASLSAYIPNEHFDHLRNGYVAATLPRTTLVHAGLRPGLPLEQQSEADLLWIRDEFLEAPPTEGLVVHGHTPSTEPVIEKHRICVDTGAFATGRLTAVKLTQDGPQALLSTENNHVDFTSL